jgi:hypothetical protein
MHTPCVDARCVHKNAAHHQMCFHKRWWYMTIGIQDDSLCKPIFS